MKKKFKILTWNVNGIRACAKKGFRKSIAQLKPDIICLQETKAKEVDIDFRDVFHESYRLNYAWSSAEKKGYSGCAIFTNNKSIRLHDTIGLPMYDKEGRGNIAFHKNFTLLNLYFPNGGASEERHNFKMKFLSKILKYFKKLEKQYGPIIICGDYNIAHSEIDIHDPISNKDSSGFLPEERNWMDKLCQNGFVDSFRTLYPKKKDIYTWWSYRSMARSRNLGWRLDYFFLSKTLKNKIMNTRIHDRILGSDHCPVELVFQL